MASTAAVAATVLALVAQDNTALRAAPSVQASTLAPLTAGDLLEVRGQRLGHLQVWDHRRERGGWVRATQLRPLAGAAGEPAQLLAVLRFLRDTPGAESLGIAYVAAYLQAVPAAQITAEPFDVLGTLAERLAQRAARPGGAAPALEAVAAYGVKFTQFERQGVMTLCYDGDAWRRVLALPADAAQRARAVLGLTRHDCLNPVMPVHERRALDQARAGLLAEAQADTAALDGALKNRLHLRRAGVWAAIAFDQARRGADAQPAAQRAVDALAAVDKAELGDDELPEWHEAALRVGPVRLAALGGVANTGPRLQLALQPGEPGQTCVVLHARGATPGSAPLAQRCTWGVVWQASAQASADGQALALAVQPLEGWGELWVFRASEAGWVVDVLPPAASGPGLGYVEFAGWAPAPKRRLLLVREAQEAGRHTRRFEVLDAATLLVDKSASTPQLLAAFAQAASPAWRRTTLALR